MCYVKSPYPSTPSCHLLPVTRIHIWGATTPDPACFPNRKIEEKRKRKQ